MSTGLLPCQAQAQVQGQQPVVGCLALDVSKEPSVSIFKGQGDRENDTPGDLNPHKHRCANLSMLAQTTKQLKTAHCSHCSRPTNTSCSTPIRLSHFCTFYSNEEVEMAVHVWLRWCQGGLNASVYRDVITGIDWLQLTASGPKGSGLLSQGQAVRQTDRSAFMFKGQDVRATYTASYSRILKSRYVTSR